MALLAMSQIWAQRQGREIAAVTVDHHLRKDSADEAQMVAAFCRGKNIPHTTLQVLSLPTKGNLSANAREARYSLMADWAGDHDIPALALGHTQDDQAETVLLRLARGAGVDGLSAMAEARPWKGVDWLRPMLGLARLDLRVWLRGKAIPWFEDPTNEDEKYDRVKARKALSLLAPLGVEPENLAATAERLQLQREALDHACAGLAAACADIGVLGEIIIRPAALADGPIELQRRLLAQALVRVSGRSYAPRHRAVMPVLLGLTKPGFKGATLGGCLIRPFNGRILICREPAAASQRLEQWDAQPCWDDRWHVSVPWRQGLQITALGPDGVKHLRYAAENGWAPPGMWQKTSRDVLLTLPAVWSQSDGDPPCLAAVPPLDYLDSTVGANAAWTAELAMRHDAPFW